MFAALPFASQPFASGPLAAGGGSAAPVIIDITASTTSAVVTYSGAATLYRLNGGAATALGASQATISGLVANTEYTLEISEDGSAWVGPSAFGTLNPGVGGGEAVTSVAASASLSLAIQRAATASSTLGAAVQRRMTASAGLSLYRQAGNTAVASISAAKSARRTATAGLSALLQVTTGTQAAASLSIATRKARSATAGLSLGAASAGTRSAGLSAMLNTGRAVVSSLSSAVQGRRTRTAGLGVYLLGGSSPAYAPQPRTDSSWSYIQTATLWSLQARDGWTGAKTYAPPVWFLCGHIEEDARVTDSKGQEFVSRARFFTSLPGVKQGDRVLLGASTLADPLAAGASEVRAITQWADAFNALGAPDYKLST